MKRLTDDMRTTEARQSFTRRRIFEGATFTAVAAAISSASAQPNSTHATALDVPVNAIRPLGPPPGIALLSRNENPFGPSPKALEAGYAAVRQGAFYADRSLVYLADMIAERHRIPRDFISISAGSGEGLCAAAQAMTRGGGVIAAPALFWDTTVKYAERQGAKLVTAPMNDDLSVDLDALEKITTRNVKLVHITNPNNPTGLLLDPERLRAFVRRVEGRATVLIDEAYNELTDDPDDSSMIDLVREEKNVIISRTFSKIYGMAGLRVGYLMARPDLTNRIRSNIMSWISGPGIAAAIASYQDHEFIETSKAKIVEGREMIVAAASENGLRAIPSQANFVFVDVGGDADRFRDAMEESKIAIRGAYSGRPNWSRVSIGAPEDVQRYIAAMPSAAERAKG